jgi:hypothetical protein
MVGDTIIIGRMQGDTPENLLLEIKSLKFAHNKEFKDCIQGAVPAILKLILDIYDENQTGKPMMRVLNTTKTLLGESQWGSLILKPLLQEIEDELAMIE